MTLRHWLLLLGLAQRQALDQIGKVQVIDLEFPTTGGSWLVLRRSHQPEAPVELLLAGIWTIFPEQEPSQIRANKLV